MNKKLSIIITLIIVALAGLIIWRNYISKQSLVANSSNVGDPVIGSATASVKIVEYSDFACASCRKMVNFLKQAQVEFGDQIAIQFKDFPLTPINPNAMIAAEAGQCAYQQNKFWEYHDLLFERQNQWTPERDPSKNFISYAEELKMDSSKFSRCLSTHEQSQAVLADMATGQATNIYQTPTLFINGKEYTGVSTYESLTKEIKAKLGQNTSTDNPSK